MCIRDSLRAADERAANGDAQDVVLPELGATIGRSPDNTVPIDEPSVSGHHGSIRFEHGEWWVRDNGSSNGTCVNDVEVKESVLKDGDRLRFGSIECVFASAPELPVPVADFAVPAAPVADFAVPAAPVADFAVPAAPVVPEAVAAGSNPVQPVVAEPAVAPVAAMAAAASPVEAHAKPELKLPPKPALRTRYELGLPEGRLAVVPQSIFKVLPDNDPIYARLLDGDGTLRLAFFGADLTAFDDVPESASAARTAGVCDLARGALARRIPEDDGLAGGQPARAHPETAH